VSVFQRAKESVVVEPVCVALSERLERAAEFRVGGFGVVLVSLAEKILFTLVNCAEVDTIRIQIWL
jgi:hypothetical protein